MESNRDGVAAGETCGVGVPPWTSALIRDLAAAYPSPAWNVARVALFARKLCELGPERAREAVGAWLNEEERPPTPAGINKKADNAARRRNPYIGTEFEHFPVYWECRCGDAHQGGHAGPPPCPKRKGEAAAEERAKAGGART